MKIERPEDIQASIMLTMKLSEWEALRDQLAAAWPSSRLFSAINDLLSQGRKTFWADAPSEDEAA
jgi:hypothetical protein